MWGKNSPSIIFVRFGHALRVVVVHLCLELKLIRHRGGASLSDVGLCKMSMPTLAKRTKSCGVSSLTGYKV